MHDFKTIEDVGKEILLKLETKIHGVGLWIFYHNIVMERLEHWAVCKPGNSEEEKKSNDEADTNEKWKLIEKYVFQPTNIAFGEGSIGYALVSKKPLKIFNTFEDPRASVGYNDLELNQRSAYLYPFLNDKDEIECVFDFYHGNIGAFHEKEELEKLINDVLNQHKKEILYLCEIERNKRSLLAVTSNLTSLVEHKNAALHLISLLTTVIPVPMVLHEEKKRKSVVSERIAIDRNVLAQKITSDLFWCSFKSKCCKTCFFQKPLGLKGTLDSECLTGILLSDREMALSRWDSFELDEKYRLWFCLKAEAKLDNERKECFTQLKTFADEFTKVFSTQKDKEFELTMVLNAVIHLKEQESKVLFELLQQRLNKPAFSPIFQNLLLNKTWLKKDMAFLLLSRIDEKGFAWNPVENPNIEVYPKKHLLKQRAAILPLYKALSNPKILTLYPPTLHAKEIITTIDSEKNTINIPTPNGERLNNIIKWKWREGPHTNIVFFWANTACFYDEVAEFCHGWLKNKAVDGAKLNELLNINCLKPEFPSPNHDEGLKFYYRTDVSSEKKSQHSKNIEAFVSFAENSYKAQKQEESARGHALKAAISAIMSRNGSHNIGSHVINWVVENINSLNIQDHRYFFRYLQQRMDFVAQISTEFPGWSTSHWFIKEIMRDFYSQRHLLNYIAASEGLKAYEGIDNSSSERINCIINNVKKHDCKHGLQQENKGIENKVAGELCSVDHNSCLDCDILNGTQVLVCNFDNCDADPNCKADLDGDVQVAIPGGIIGSHAFFTIMENFIRNSAKHCYAPHPQQNEHMFININVWNYEKEHRHYTIRIRDNYSYVSGLVDKDITDEGESLKEKSILVFLKDIQAVNKIKKCLPKDETVKIKFDSIENLDKSTGTDMIFIIDDGDMLRDNRKNNYERLVKDKKIRFVEGTHWEVFLKPYLDQESPRAFKLYDLIDFLHKYYEPVHIKINRKIMNPLINRDGSLRKSDWGLAEMKISAGYLNGKYIKEIGDRGKKNLDNLIKAIAFPERNVDGKIKAYRLGYEFKIRKPIDMLLIGCGCKKDEQTSNLKMEAILHIDSYEAEKYSAEMAVIYDSGDNNDQLLSLLKNNGDKKEEIKSEIEKYPARLFIATNEKHFIKDKGPFLKKRIVIVTKNDFDKWISESEKNPDEEGHKYKKFKNRFLNRWLLHVKKEIRDEGNAIDLIIQPKEGKLDEKSDSSTSDSLGIITLLNVLGKKDFINGDQKELLIQKVRKGEISKFKNFATHVLEMELTKKTDVSEFLKEHGYGIFQGSNIVLEDINKFYGIGEDEDYLPRTMPKVFREEKGIEVGHKRFSTCCSSDLLNEIGQIIDKEKDVKNKTIRYQRHRAVNAIEKGFDYLYRENLGGGAMHFHLFSHPPYWIEQTVCNLLENGLLRIGIADERVAGSKVLKTDDYYKDLKAAGIVFIKNFFGFELDYAYGNKEIKKEIKTETASDLKKDSIIDILVVHQGILDKIPNMSKAKIEEELSNLKEKIPFIFVTSGRGRPDEVPDGVKFVPFGIIVSTLLQRPHSKLLLIKQLLGGIINA